jgi:hypothetical protein
MSSVIPDPENPTRYLIGDATDPFIGAHQGVAVLENVHLPASCEGEFCVIHNPSEHHMRSWPLVWRDDKGVMERMCAHGVGHPDPDDAAFQARVGRGSLNIHGCDVCCWTAAGSSQ